MGVQRGQPAVLCCWDVPSEVGTWEVERAVSRRPVATALWSAGGPSHRRGMCLGSCFPTSPPPLQALAPPPACPPACLCPPARLPARLPCAALPLSSFCLPARLPAWVQTPWKSCAWSGRTSSRWVGGGMNGVAHKSACQGTLLRPLLPRGAGHVRAPCPVMVHPWLPTILLRTGPAQAGGETGACKPDRGPLCVCILPPCRPWTFSRGW